MGKVILEMRNICKTFPGVRANHNVCIDLREGEVLALLGENGAGKSVLMSILDGFYQPDSGEIYIDGRQVRLTSPQAAIARGIGMIHQHFMLIPVFTALENIILGLELKGDPFLRREAYRSRVQEIIDRYGLAVDLDKRVADMSVGEQQRVEIVKTLFRSASILILDEPTAVLTPGESRDLFRVIKQFQADGKSVIFISHKMDELMEFSDRITILRQGEVITTFDTAQTSIKELASTMVGGDVQWAQNVHEKTAGDIRLRLEDVCIRDQREVEIVKHVSLEVRAGEILAVAGIDGNGQNELAEGILGLRHITSGRIYADGEDITNASVKSLLERGFGFVPPDRKSQGLVLDFSIRDNLLLEEMDRPAYSSRGFLRHREILRFAKELIGKFDIRPANPDALVKNCSGGNQQKVIVARVFSRRPRVLVAVNPVRGIDINATEFIHRRLLEQRKDGACIIVVSTDLDEVFSISDRIAVICQGELMGVCDAAAVTPEDIGLMMTGVRKEDASCG